MIVVKIEMWPGGDESKAYSYGPIVITNIGGNATMADYQVVIAKSPTIAKSPGTWKRAKVFNFNRARLGAHDLLLRALIACIGNRSATDLKKIEGEGPHFEREEGAPMP